MITIPLHSQSPACLSIYNRYQAQLNAIFNAYASGRLDVAAAVGDCKLCAYKHHTGNLLHPNP